MFWLILAAQTIAESNNVTYFLATLILKIQYHTILNCTTSKGLAEFLQKKYFIIPMVSRSHQYLFLLWERNVGCYDCCVQSDPLNGSAALSSKNWTNKRIEPLTTTFYLASAKMGPLKPEPITGDQLSGFDCTFSLDLICAALTSSLTFEGESVYWQKNIGPSGQK